MDHDQQVSFFEQLLDEQMGIVLKVARSFTFCDEDCSDLVQEILIRLWKAIPTFRAEAKVSTWVYRVALNRALTWNRDEAKRREGIVPLGATTLATRADEPNQELIDQLYIEIRKLDEIDRSLILLSLDGCTYAEMSDLMGMAESNVGVRINRAKKKLAKQITEHCHEL